MFCVQLRRRKLRRFDRGRSSGTRARVSRSRTIRTSRRRRRGLPRRCRDPSRGSHGRRWALRARDETKAGGGELKVKKLNPARVSWNAELEAERTYVPSPTDDTKSAAMNGVGTSTDDVELDSPVKSASPDVKRGGRKLLDGGDKVIAASPRKGGAKLLHREMPKLPRCPRTSLRRSPSV